MVMARVTSREVTIGRRSIAVAAGLASRFKLCPMTISLNDTPEYQRTFPTIIYSLCDAIIETLMSR